MFQSFIVGLTGGLASGKSEVSKRFAALGVEIVDADDLARVVVEPGRPALRDIVKRHGEHALNEDGSLNRRWLREVVFSDQSEREWLEALLHPLIASEIEARLHACAGSYAMLSSPLLFEAGQQSFVNRTLLVDVPRRLQIMRAMQRDNYAQSGPVRNILRAQMSREQRLYLADDVLDNSPEDFKGLDEKIAALDADYRRRGLAASEAQSAE